MPDRNYIWLTDREIKWILTHSKWPYCNTAELVSNKLKAALGETV